MTLLLEPSDLRKVVSGRRLDWTTPLAAWRSIATPMGRFVLGVDGLGRVVTGWQRGDWPDRSRPATPTLLPAIARRLERYFNGEAVSFDDLPLPEGTGFQRACWRAARSVPRGETISYKELARRAGSPTAARAAGQTMRRNPTPILVPCHRVVGADGELHGFGGSCDRAGRELGLKAWLLRIEQA